ncbi:MAG: hypothetical protein GX646_07745 [Bacteroidales bacterium]|nr:hypothetical protein [Bacteroidales bacterium]NLD63776.1 hypothetical protein [Bacteroidales bacterium]
MTSVSLSGQHIGVTADRTDVGRNETIAVTVKAADENGEPVQALITISAVHSKHGSDKGPSGAPGSYRGRNVSYNDVFTMIQQIKPFRLADGRIIFTSVAPDTNGRQDGALIVIDGITMGQDPRVIEHMNPLDIDRINVSTEFIDIQRYTGFNTTGVIEIWTKTGRSSSGRTGTTAGSDTGADGDGAETVKNAADSIASARSGKVILRGMEVTTDVSGKAHLDIPSGRKRGEVIIIGEYRTASGILKNETATVKVR